MIPITRDRCKLCMHKHYTVVCCQQVFKSRLIISLVGIQMEKAKGLVKASPYCSHDETNSIYLELHMSLGGRYLDWEQDLSKIDHISVNQWCMVCSTLCTPYVTATKLTSDAWFALWSAPFWNCDPFGHMGCNQFALLSDLLILTIHLRTPVRLYILNFHISEWIAVKA